MALSFGVLLLCLFYNIKIKGLGGWLHELYAVPFVNLDFGREDSGAGKRDPSDVDTAAFRKRMWNATMNGQAVTYANTGSAAHTPGEEAAVGLIEADHAAIADRDEIQRITRSRMRRGLQGGPAWHRDRRRRQPDRVHGARSVPRRRRLRPHDRRLLQPREGRRLRPTGRCRGL